MTNALDKTVRIGVSRPAWTKRGFSIFCRIQIKPRPGLEHGALSIMGVEGPRTGGDCCGSSGQIIMDTWHLDSYAPGWDAAKVEQFREAWKTWHLNDMRSGSPAQRAYLAAHGGAQGYDEDCATLVAAGLDPDPNMTPPYKYGSAWLREELPLEVVAFLQSLPDTDIKPAWV